MTTITYLHAYRAARGAVEREAYMRQRTRPTTLHVPPRIAPITGRRRSLWRITLFVIGWSLTLVAGLWLAAHDPLTLHQLLMHARGEAS